MSQDPWNEQQSGQSRPSSDKEWQLLEKLLMQSGKESRRARRWGIFFKSLMFLYMFVILFLFSVPTWLGDKGGSIGGSHTALVDINGVISDQEFASADAIANAAALNQGFSGLLQLVPLHHLAGAALHCFRACLQDIQFPGNAIFGPLDIHGALVMFFDDQGLAREFLNLVVE